MRRKNNSKLDTLDSNTALKYLHSSKLLYACGLINVIEKCLSDNPYDKKSSNFLMWKEQCAVNFPILYLASIYLYIYARDKGCNIFLFVTRDCCHWYKIFHKLFPHCDVHYYHSSRNMFDKATYKDNHAYDEYTRSLVKDDLNKVIYIDVHGTCKRMFEYFSKKFDNVPYGFLLSASRKTYSDMPKVTQKYRDLGKLTTLIFDVRGGPCESLNYDCIGTLQDFSEYGPIRDNLEYNKNLIEPYHKCIQHLIDQITPLGTDLEVDRTPVLLNSLYNNIRDIFATIQINKPQIMKQVRHIGTHKKRQCNENRLDFENLQFKKLLSDDTVYSLVWKGLYNDKPCAIKMVTLKSGIYYDQLSKKYMDKDGNRCNVKKFRDEEVPFLHSEFKDHKAMSIESFNDEVDQLIYLSDKKFAPKFYGYCIYNRQEIDYGFIVMDLVDSSVKQIILERNLTNKENDRIQSTIHKLHKNGIIHGDLKPSNIGAYLDKYGYIDKCVFLDCQRVKYGLNKNNRKFHRMVGNDLQIYEKHIEKNINDRKN